MGFCQSFCNYSHDSYTLFCFLQFRQCRLWKNNWCTFHTDPVFSADIHVCYGYWNDIYTPQYSKRVHYPWNQAAFIRIHCKYNFLSNYSAGVPLEYSLLSFLANDILQFAGLSFILIGIFKKLNVRTIKIFAISIGFSLIATYFSDFTFSNIYLNQFLGNFIETHGQNIVSCFPILNWFIVPVCGMLFGENLIRCNDKDDLYSRIIRPTHVLTIVLIIVGFITLEGMFSVTGGTVPEKLEYLHASLPDILILIIVTLFVTSFFYFLAKRLSPGVIDFVKKISINVTVIYIIQ